MIHTIKVTQEDINLGQPNSTMACPISLAIHRQLGKEAYVWCELVEINNADIRLPENARKFIYAFDSNSEPVSPFEFELEL